MPDASPDSRPNLRPRPWEILALLPLGTAIGGLLGAGFGAFYWRLIYSDFGVMVATASRLATSTVGPKALRDAQLFMLRSEINFARSDRVQMITGNFTRGWRAGLVISLVLVIAIALISKLRCPFRTAFGVQLRVVRGAFLFWLVGGINAVIVASVAPDWFDKILYPVSSSTLSFPVPQTATPDFLREAWAHGAVWGFRAGLVLATIGCLISFANKWRKVEEAERENRLANESNAQTAHV